MTADTQNKFDAQRLINFAFGLLHKVGLEKEMAQITAKTLVESDLMGYTTHGLNLLPDYLKEIEKGDMLNTGVPEVINDAGTAVTWDGRYLPGPWLVHRAMDLAFERIKDHPVVTVTIGRSHHIGCLATYPEYATKKGLMLLLACSDPRNGTVAPFGGIDPVYSPNPLAVGIPTKKDPVIFDSSMSSTANGVIFQKHKSGEKLGGPWLINRDGTVSDDPADFMKEPPANLLPVGGTDLGFKGFAMGILIEALTSGLAGHGRKDRDDRWGSSVFLQVINPEAFGGTARFMDETSYFSEQCLSSTPLDAEKPVRMPGQRALQLRDEQLKNGLRLHPTIVPALEVVAEKYGVRLPFPDSAQ
ncbi:MAG: Ldh family oxidoreductase [Cyclobacteriaceae bacterium]|nr:Ldh family oxidoreductase [Cyclobacteriaceae bacterium]